MTIADVLARGDSADCVTHAHAAAQVLLVAGHAPWIARIRDVTVEGDQVTHGRLTPRRFAHCTWTTHYVCCSDGIVYDPYAAEPLPLEAYTRAVFGRELELQEFLSADETARRVREGTFREAFRPGRR